MLIFIIQYLQEVYDIEILILKPTTNWKTLKPLEVLDNLNRGVFSLYKQL